VSEATGELASIHTLSAGEVSAEVSNVGASLRNLRVRGVDLVRATLDDIPPLAAGVVLVPWPNRVEGGRWLLNGDAQQLELTEPELGHANHGLLAHAGYAVESTDPDRVLMTASVEQPPGYPFILDTSVEYLLTADGIDVVHGVVNRSPRPAPVAIGAHPYLRIGEAPVTGLLLTVPASQTLLLDDAHIPRGATTVDGTSFDLRSGRAVGEAPQHACYTGFTVEHDGVVRHRLRGAEGSEVVLWAEQVFTHLQVFVTDSFPAPDGPVGAIALEPMTAPPNALRTGESLRWLQPGERWNARWGIRLLG
jgi:aldose 1-epimerase